jgi:hypothetical protein
MVEAMLVLIAGAVAAEVAVVVIAVVAAAGPLLLSQSVAVVATVESQNQFRKQPRQAPKQSLR